MTSSNIIERIRIERNLGDSNTADTWETIAKDLNTELERIYDEIERIHTIVETTIDSVLYKAHNS